MGVDPHIAGLNCIEPQLFHDRVSLFLEIKFAFYVKVFLKIREAEFIGIFEFAVAFRLFLNGVVGEVDELVVELFERELLAGGADVAVLVPIGLDVALDAGEKHEHADVELAFVVEKGVLDVFLDDVGVFVVVDLHVMDVVEDVDALASVGLLAGLDDPDCRPKGPPEFVELFLRGDVVSEWDELEGVQIIKPVVVL